MGERPEYVPEEHRRSEIPGDWEHNVDVWIHHLRGQSSYQHRQEGDAEILSDQEGREKYFLRKAQGGKDAGLSDAIRLLDEKIPGGVDSLREFKKWLDDEDENGLGVFYAREGGEKGEIVAANCVGVLPIPEVQRDQKGRLEKLTTDDVEDAREALLVGWSAATQEGHRTQRVTDELFPHSLKFGAEMAKRWGMDLKAYATEAVDKRLALLGDREDRGAEKMKPFYYDAEGNLRELPYLNPEGEKYHLFVRMFDGRDRISVNELLDIVRTIYYDYYDMDEAKVEKNRGKWEAALDALRGAVEGAKGDELHILSPREQKTFAEQLAGEGKQLVEHVSTYEEERTKARASISQK